MHMKNSEFQPKIRFSRRLMLAFIPLLLVPIGCASVSVKRGTEAQVSEKPQKIYVRDFSDTDGKWNVDREGQELADFKKKTREMLTSDIVERASKHLVPSVKDDKTATLPPQKAWLITGRFTRVNQGSRFLRAAIGFGSGGTKLETEVSIYDLSNGMPSQPFLTFSTTGGSGAEPGALANANPVGFTLSATGHALPGVSMDIVRTSREITAALSEYMYAHRWISEDERVEAKYKE